jgi:20S proteasome alpha/beta subunit
VQSLYNTAVMMKNKKTTKKIKIGATIGLLAAGVVSSAVVGINYLNSQQFKYYDLGSFN